MKTKEQNQKDLLTSIIIGLVTGAMWAGIFAYLGIFNFYPALVWFVPPVMALLFIFGLYLGRWLAYFNRVFISFSRYAMVGFLNTGIDFGIFNFLMFLTGIAGGLIVPVFKTVSFVGATINSYYWNKFWTFREGPKRRKNGGEFMKFLAVSIVGILLNVGIAGVGFAAGPKFGLNQIIWNNISVAIATVSNLVWNFIGYKLLVFNGKRSMSGLKRIKSLFVWARSTVLVK